MGVAGLWEGRGLGPGVMGVGLHFVAGTNNMFFVTLEVEELQVCFQIL